MEKLSKISSNNGNAKATPKFKQLILIRSQVRKAGIPTNFVGYKYIIEALRFMISSQEPLFMDEVYLKVASSNNVSKASVEVSVRNAIKKASQTNNSYIKKIIKSSHFDSLSNSVFLSTLKEIIIEKILTDNVKF